MNDPGKLLPETASQTAGPYLHIGMMPAAAGIDCDWAGPGNQLTDADQRIRIEGTVVDGLDSPVRDAQIEIWQADEQGRYYGAGDAGFTGFGRAVADFETGLWWFETVKPGPVTNHDGRLMAPHVSVMVFARGINIGLHTRLYFDDEAEANASDPVLALVENPRRRDTLIAAREVGGETPLYRFDIRLQGARETVFFDC